MNEPKWKLTQLEDGPAKRCRKWKIAVRTAMRYPNGRLKWVYVRYSGSYSQAVAEAKRLAQGYADGSLSPARKWTFDEYAAHVDDAKLAAGAIDESTHEKCGYLRRDLSRHIGGMLVSELTPSQIESAIIACRNGDTPSGKPLSGTTLESVHGYGHGVMERAVSEGLATRNPFDLAVRPKSDTRERKALDVGTEVEFALSLDPRDRHHMAFLIMLEAGLRRGECCALRWSDVADGRLLVSKTLRDDGDDHPTKSRKARLVPISSALAEALGKRKEHQAVRMRLHGLAQVDSTRVLANDLGEPMLPSNLTRWWYRHRSDFGMDGWTPHEFRHTFCTNLAEADVHPKVMQQLMGHASERTSMQVYTHVHDAQLDAAISHLDDRKSQNVKTSSKH